MTIHGFAGPPAPATLRPDRLARRHRIVRSALCAPANSDYDQVKLSGRRRARRRDVFHYTIRAFQLQPKFYRVVMMLTATTDTYAADLYRSVASQFHDTVRRHSPGRSTPPRS